MATARQKEYRDETGKAAVWQTGKHEANRRAGSEHGGSQTGCGRREKSRETQRQKGERGFRRGKEDRGKRKVKTAERTDVEAMEICEQREEGEEKTAERGSRRKKEEAKRVRQRKREQKEKLLKC